MRVNSWPHMSAVILQAINGISLAALLFLLASGFTLTFGLMRVVNMAYGAYYLLGGYVGYSIMRRPAASSWRSCAAGSRSWCSALSSTASSFARSATTIWRRCCSPSASRSSSARCVSRSGAATTCASRRRPGLRGGMALPGGLFYPKYRFALIVFGTLTAVLLWLLYHKTQIGAVVRAGVDDREMVNATGINVDRLFVLVSALASFLAGAAGVAGGAFLTLNPGAEWDILVLALVVVIIGGPRQSRRRDSRQHHRRPARRLWPLAVSRTLLFHPVWTDGDPAPVPGDRNFRQGALSDARDRTRHPARRTRVLRAAVRQRVLGHAADADHDLRVAGAVDRPAAWPHRTILALSRGVLRRVGLYGRHSSGPLWFRHGVRGTARHPRRHRARRCFSPQRCARAASTSS